jgi:hypothetical protein
MAHELHVDKHTLNFPVATDLSPRFPVKLVASTTGGFVAPIASANDVPFGVSNNATYLASTIANTPNERTAVYYSQNSVKVRANGSVGFCADVFVSSTNGGVGPSGIITASGHWILGQTLEAALAGEIVTIFVNPRKS